MFYTPTHPAVQGDRIYLFPSRAAAHAAGGARAVLYGVAVHFEELARRVIADWSDPGQNDLPWTAPAQARADGSVIVKGPVPRWIFFQTPDEATWIVRGRAEDEGSDSPWPWKWGPTPFAPRAGPPA